MTKSKSHDIDLDKAFTLAGLSLNKNGDDFTIRSKFFPWRKNNIGLYVFIGLGVLCIYICVDSAKSYIGLVIGFLLGGALTIGASLTLLKQVTDFVKISSDQITFRNSLVTRSIPIHPNLRIRINAKTEYVKLRSQPGSGTYFRVVEIYLVHNGKEKRLIDYQMDDTDASTANALSTFISHEIKKRIHSVNESRLANTFED